MTDKEKIDYEIKAKKEARDAELKEWSSAGWVLIVAFFFLVLLSEC